MKAKELIKILNNAVKEHGNKDILILDKESGWYNSVNDIKVENLTDELAIEICCK